MLDAIYQLIAAFVAAFGFAMYFGARKRFFFVCALGGLLSWGVYLLTDYLFHSLFLSNFAGSAFAVLYAEILARCMKCTATMIVVPSVIPLSPGGMLYYTLDAAVHGDLAATRQIGGDTLISALAISAGISVVMALRELHMKRQA